jgi:4'-phosphopantetheinyl transferase
MVFPAGCTWLLQAAADVPRDDDWLSPIERVRLGQLRIAKRRADWRLGRWTAKHAAAAALGVGYARIAVIATESGAPLALLDGVPAPVAISLSHAAGRGLCAVASPGVAIGCDLECIAPRRAAFLRDYFTAAERRQVGTDARRATLVWCAKEAVLKAIGEGLREDTRAVEVTIGGVQADGRTRLEVVHAGRHFAVGCRELDGLVAVIAIGCPARQSSAMRGCG